MPFNFGDPKALCGCGCTPNGNVCATVTACGAPVVGATISASGLGSATTNSSGHACLSGAVVGTVYSVTAIGPTGGCTSFVATIQNVTAMSGTTGGPTINLTPATGWECCTASGGEIETSLATATLNMTNACSSFVNSIAPDATICSWQFGTLTYHGNCIWKLSVPGCASGGGGTFCTPSTATGPPTLPLSLTFNDPGDPDCQSFPTGNMAGCASPTSGVVNCYSSSFGPGPFPSIWPITVTS